MTEINNRIEEQVFDYIKGALNYPISGVSQLVSMVILRFDIPDKQADTLVLKFLCQLFPQPLDDKELREKNIKAEIVNAYHTWRKHCERLDHPKRIKEFTHRELYEQTASYFADQILALLPSTEEARRQERERIIGEVERFKRKPEQWNDKTPYLRTGSIFIEKDDWQALKGGE